VPLRCDSASYKRGVDRPKIGSNDRKFGSSDKKIGSNDRKFGSSDKKIGSNDRKFGSSDKKIGSDDLGTLVSGLTNGLEGRKDQLDGCAVEIQQRVLSAAESL